MSLRVVALVVALGAGCATPEPARDRAALARLQGGDGAPASLRFEEAAPGLTVTNPDGSLPQEALSVQIIDHCAPSGPPDAPTREGGFAEAPPTASPELAAPPTGEDVGTTAAMKGERAGSTPVTADESGQTAPHMRPTSATPEQRALVLTPTREGWTVDAPITLEELLGRAVALEGPAGPMCGEVRPAMSGAPAPAG